MIDPTPHLERFDSYEQACKEFRWQIPEQFNIASAISRRHKDAITRIAIKDVRPGGINTYTFGGIDFVSDKFANLLAKSGVQQGDSVAVIVPQSAALLVAHFGILKLGAVVVPLSPYWPSHVFERALRECHARAVVTGKTSLDAIRDTAAAETLFITDVNGQDNDEGNEGKDFWRELNSASSDFTAVETSSSSPAFIFFKPHLDGNLTGVV